MRLSVRPAAREDILHDYERYLQLGLPGVAAGFLTAVNEAIDALAAMPGAGRQDNSRILPSADSAAGH